MVHSAPRGASLVAQMVKNLPATLETWIRSLGWEDPLEEGMATHSSILVWRIPWAERPGRLRVIHGVADLAMTEQLTTAQQAPRGLLNVRWELGSVLANICNWTETSILVWRAKLGGTWRPDERGSKSMVSDLCGSPNDSMSQGYWCNVSGSNSFSNHLQIT